MAAELREALAVFDDPRFRFDERRHRYTYDGKYLRSVSQLKREFCVPFDKERIAGFVAKKRGVLKSTVLREWEEKRDVASRRGDVVHWCVEQYRKTGVMPAIPDDAPLDEAERWDVRRRLQEFEAFYAVHLSGSIPIASELRIFSASLGIAGTLDDLSLWPGGRLIVGDWKTNGNFRVEGDGERVHQNLLGPFAHLPDVEHYTFSIQVSAYRLILADHGIRTHGGFICHLPEDGPPRLHRAVDFRRELWDYLNAG